ncbi:MAG: hypothetical protein WEC39_00265 [Patescibacteria group bacterium]
MAKQNKIPWVKSLLVRLPHLPKLSPALSSSLKIFGASLLAAVLVLGVYDQFYGNSPLSRKSRLVKEAIAICNKAQEMAANPVDLSQWPLKETFSIQTLGDAANFNLDPASYATEKTTSDEIFKATTWLTEKYGSSITEYSAAQTRCDTLAQEYQEKYAY